MLDKLELSPDSPAGITVNFLSLECSRKVGMKSVKDVEPSHLL